MTHATNTNESKMTTAPQTKKRRLDSDSKQEAPPVGKGPESSIFFRLPRELRDEVYKHLLLDGENVDVTSSRGAAPAIGHVCRQLRHETALIFSKSKFTFRMHMNDFAPFIEWNNALLSYLVLADEPSPFTIVWEPCPPGNEDVAVANLLRYLQCVFKENMGFTPEAASTKEQRKLLDPLSRKRAELVLMVKALRDKGLGWDDVNVSIGHAIDAAMVCGEQFF